MSAEITRHFVTIDGRWGSRQVHYRRAGSGPAVLLLHQSPQSSREQVELMQHWALHFTVLAPDSPGYGQSDALGPATVPMEGFADATLEFADAIGLRRFGVYGYHTGSSVGLWLAARHPERVTALAANGLAQFTAAEIDNILAHYLPPVVPAWDGSHLAWLWGRVREQTVFFPWHDRSEAARLALDMPTAERLQASLVDFLRAGDNYAIAYRAAFESRPGTLFPALRTPLLVTAVDGDPLQAHLARYQGLPAGAQTAPVRSTKEALDLSLQHLLAHRGDSCPAPVATRPIAGRLWRNMVRTQHGTLQVRLEHSGREEPVLLLHHAGQSSETSMQLASPLLTQRPMIIPDLPGHGDSDAPSRLDALSVAECAAAAGEVAGRLGFNEVVLVGQGTGACTALRLAELGGLRRPRLALLDLPSLGARQREAWRQHGLPSTAPQWHGGHLLLAWHLLRDGRLFFPWFERTRQGSLAGEPDLDEQRLQLELLDLLKASGHWQALLNDALDFPLTDALYRARDTVVLGASRASAWREATRAAARTADLPVIELAADTATWLPVLIRDLRI
jgi:pimeloyl-ACP methyl ester carboxylesterase